MLMTLSRNLSIRFLLSFIIIINSIDTRMIAKKVIKTTNELDVIEKSFGSAIIATVMHTNEMASVNPLSKVRGKHKVAKFKKPV